MLPGPLIPPDMALALRAVQQAPQREQKLPGGMTVSFDSVDFDAETGTTTFSGTVSATYGQTKIECRLLTVNSVTKKGSARDGVSVTDPEASLLCDSLEFNWQEQTGTAQNVRLQAVNVHLTATVATVEPGTWTLKSAKGSLSRVGLAPVYFEADTVTLRPGDRGVARRVYFHVYGAKLGPWPTVSFTLNNRVKGIPLPSFVNKKGFGLGVGWEGSVPLGLHAAANGFWESFPHREPGFGLQYAYSPLSRDNPTLIAPQGDLGERFSNGWFQDLGTREPEAEHRSIRFKRKTLGIGSFWNQSTSDRPVESSTVSKQLELVAEGGGTLGGRKPTQDGPRMDAFGLLGTLRLQSIRSSSDSGFLNRALGQTTLISPQKELVPALKAHLRFDGFGTVSEQSTYAWGRVQAALVYEPSSTWTFGVAYGIGAATGRPDFPFDPLIRDREFSVRADWKSGPYTVRYLARYDDRTKSFFDHEYEIALAAREFEPYILVRQSPSETRMGIRFRIDNLRDRLMKRKQDR